MSALVLRFAQPAERKVLEDIQRRASLMHKAYRAALLARPAIISLPVAQLEDRRVRVAEAGGAVLGFSVVLPREGQACELDGLFVEPDRWKRGIGRALMRDAFELGAQAGATVMEVLSNPYAEGFYARLGFVRTGTVTTQLGIGSKMRRTLQSA